MLGMMLFKTGAARWLKLDVFRPSGKSISVMSDFCNRTGGAVDQGGMHEQYFNWSDHEHNCGWEYNPLYCLNRTLDRSI